MTDCTQELSLSIDTKTLNAVAKAMQDRLDSSFQPTATQERAKSAFWQRFEQAGLPGYTPVPDLSIAARYASDSPIQKWWDSPGFNEWFWNRNSFNEHLDYLAQVSLEALGGILSRASSADSSKVAAAKLILEASKKIGKQGEDTGEYADKKIQAMSKQELEDYISKFPKLVNQVDK